MCVRVYVSICVCCVCVTCTYSGAGMHPNIRTYRYSYKRSCMLRSRTSRNVTNMFQTQTNTNKPPTLWERGRGACRVPGNMLKGKTQTFLPTVEPGSPWQVTQLLVLLDGVRISQDSTMLPTVTRQDIKEEPTRLHRCAAVADVSLSCVFSRIKSLDTLFGPSPSIEIIFGIATELEGGFDGVAAGRMDGLRQTVGITCDF